MVDLTKLSAAPFIVIFHGFVAELRPWRIQDATGKTVAWFCREEDAKQAALARNALDIMLRRGWWSCPYINHPTAKRIWIAINAFCVQIERGGNTGTYFLAADPFTPLVEADAWLTAREKEAADHAANP